MIMHRAYEVLLVEDNPADARLTRDALLNGPIPKRVTVVTDGVEALDYIRRRGAYNTALRPDIVLLDLNLPKRDGMHVLKEIKSDPALRAITVVVLTTSDQFRDVDAAYEYSANCYVVKPRDLDHFYAVMRGIEEFWMSTAALPTASMDPMPSSKTEKDGPGMDPDIKKGSASARLSHRQTRSRPVSRKMSPADRVSQPKHSAER